MAKKSLIIEDQGERALLLPQGIGRRVGGQRRLAVIRERPAAELARLGEWRAGKTAA